MSLKNKANSTWGTLKVDLWRTHVYAQAYMYMHICVHTCGHTHTHTDTHRTLAPTRFRRARATYYSLKESNWKACRTSAKSDFFRNRKEIEAQKACLTCKLSLLLKNAGTTFRSRGLSNGLWTICVRTMRCGCAAPTKSQGASKMSAFSKPYFASYKTRHILGDPCNVHIIPRTLYKLICVP